MSNYGQTRYPRSANTRPQVRHLTAQLTAPPRPRPPRRRQIELTFCGVQFASPDGHTAGQKKRVGRGGSQSSTASVQ